MTSGKRAGAHRITNKKRGAGDISRPSRNPAAPQKGSSVTDLILSLFPGIGLLDLGFEQAGFCIVRGPDEIWGGDIRRFHPPPGRFHGVIGGPPCQDFSSSRRIAPTGYGLEMIGEFVRVVTQTAPLWWLMENVPRVPDVQIPGYSWQRLDLLASSYGLNQHRRRHIQFGSRDGTALVLPRHASRPVTAGAVTATDTTTPLAHMLIRQGLPADFAIPAFTDAAFRRAVGNGVPVPMAYALAQAVRDRVPAASVTLCACGCGRGVTDKATYATGACRMRAMRRRNVTDQAAEVSGA